MLPPPARDRSQCAQRRWSKFDVCDPNAVSFAHANGYVVLHEAADLQLINQLRSVVEGWLADNGLTDVRGRLLPGAGWTGCGFDDPRWVALQQAVLCRPLIATIASNEAVIGFFKTLMGQQVQPHCGDICRVSLPGADHLTTRPHQDQAYAAETTSGWTMWLPLRDCSTDDGGLAVWPTSHLGGLLDHGSNDGLDGCHVPDDTVWATGNLAAGDAVVFAAMTVHRAWHNRSMTQPRLSIDLRYRPTINR